MEEQRSECLCVDTELTLELDFVLIDFIVNVYCIFIDCSPHLHTVVFLSLIFYRTKFLARPTSEKESINSYRAISLRYRTFNFISFFLNQPNKLRTAHLFSPITLSLSIHIVTRNLP